MAGGTGKAPLHIQLRQKFQGDDVSTDWLNRSIFKVPNHLRQISKKAYEPQVISIGPYHHRKGQLKKMEGYKMFYLKMLLKRRQEISLERYVTALKGMEAKARKFYSEPLNHIGGEKFVEMMLLDGCFIIELIRKSAMEELRLENDHLLKLPLILRRAMLDLLLVENQLPYFILSELFDMTVMPNGEEKDFKGAAIKFFSKIMPIPPGRHENQDIKHLLGLLHDSCQASSPNSQEVRISCLPEKVIGLLCPKAKLNRCSSEVVQSSPPEVSPQSKSSEEVKIPLSDTDNLCFGEAAAPSTSFLEPKSSEELRFLQAKAMTIPSSSLSKSSEEIVSTAAPFVDFSVPNSLKEVKFLPSDSSHPWYLEEMDASAAEPLITFSPPKSSKEVRSQSAASISFSPQVMEQSAASVSFSPQVMKQSAASVSFSPQAMKQSAASASAASNPMNEEKNRKWQFIRSATELNEAGINFKGIKGSLLDIKFEKGLMSIPTLSINDDTESILRNLVAYEQCFKGASSKCFTDYIRFMDCLISTTKDVELLCHGGVIDNWLGDDEVVATIFNKLCDSVLISEEDFCYAETFKKVNEHCGKDWNRYKVYLWYNSVNNPWAVISVVAAVILLLVTVLQSVYSVLSFYIK